MLSSKLVEVKASGDPVSAAEEGLTHIDDNTWQITDANKRVLERDGVIELEKDDGAGGFEDISFQTVNKLNGTFTFDGVGFEDTETIRVKSGNYLPLTTVAEAHDYTLNRQVNLAEVPRFLENYIKRIPTTKFASGSLSQWDITNSYFNDVLTSGEPFVLDIKVTSTTEPTRLWALLESSEMTAAIESPQDQVVSFISTDELLSLGG